MKRLFLVFFVSCFLLAQSSPCFSQNNNPQPPFSNLHSRPNVHPYVSLGPFNDAMDYQQMFYLTEKNDATRGEITNERVKRQAREEKRSVQQGCHAGIRPTGHKTYFMNLP